MSKWKKVKLGDICDIERGGSPRPIDEFITQDINGINWIKIGDTSDNSMYITKTKQKIKPEGMKKSRYVQPGDFLLTNSMSFGRPYILNIDGCIHDGWLVLRDKNNYFHKEYLYYALGCKTTYEKFKCLAVGGVVNNLNSTKVKQLEILLPPLETQKQIAKTLDSAAQLLAMRKQQLAELDSLIKSTFYNMFGDPVTNEKGWELSCFGELSKVRQGLQIPISERKKVYGVNCYKYITVQYLNGRKEEEYIENPRPNVICVEDDVLMTRTGNTGMVITGVSGVFHNNFFLIDYDKRKLIKNYLIIFLNYPSIQADIINRATTSTIPDLNHGEFYKITVPLPPIFLQTQFAEIVTTIEEQKALVKKAIDETQILFDSLMSEYFE